MLLNLFDIPYRAVRLCSGSRYALRRVSEAQATSTTAPATTTTDITIITKAYHPVVQFLVAGASLRYCHVKI